LGRLARWLRLQGYDTLFACPFPDPTLIQLAQSEGRIVLTRDRRLPAKTIWNQVLVLEARDYAKQLVELRKKLRLSRARPFSRCLDCNELIQESRKEEVRGRVPEQVFHSYGRFFTCPKCGKIFWRGSHVKASMERLRRLAA